MSEAEHLADALQGLFANPQHGWFTAFPAAVAGLSAEQAAQSPTPGFNSIWQIAHHIRFWHEVVLRRLHGLPVDEKALWESRGWKHGPTPDEAEWTALCGEVLRLNLEVANLVSGLTDEALDESYAPGRAKRYQVIQGLIAHNSYHTCEIISVRHMLGLWLERV